MKVKNKENEQINIFRLSAVEYLKSGNELLEYLEWNYNPRNPDEYKCLTDVWEMMIYSFENYYNAVNQYVERSERKNLDETDTKA